MFTSATVRDVALLGVGRSTVVWSHDVAVPQHVVVVHRSAEDCWWLVQTQAADVAERVVRFDPEGEPAGRGLWRSIRVPTDERGRLLSVGAG
ncbi:hypothetical protein ACLQ24_30465, partial [Micromonospora sp. DT4]|uniref:hypothetical protein n=1 Tax=Micromonospora sp. DT4 TaxID=3393438 RepID=UPI003CFBA869